MALSRNRPYLTCSVLQSILGGFKRKTIIMEARWKEEDLWKQDDPKYRQPLPTHHRALSPEDGAEKILDILQKLGWTDAQDKPIGKKVYQHIKTMYGAHYVGEVDE